MNTKLLFSAALSVLLLAQTASSAQAFGFGNFKERWNIVKENITERHEFRKENRDERKEDKQADRMERREKVTGNIADRVEKRFAAHEERLNKWLTKAQEYSDKLKAKGKNVTAAEAAIATAKADLATAKTLGATAVTQLRAIEPAAWSEQKPEVKAAKEAVQKAQVAYAQVAKDFKAIVQALRTANQAQ
jgi:hypothetical protein